VFLSFTSRKRKTSNPVGVYMSRSEVISKIKVWGPESEELVPAGATATVYSAPSITKKKKLSTVAAVMLYPYR